MKRVSIVEGDGEDTCTFHGRLDRNGERCGRGILEFGDGSTLSGRFVNGELSGEAVLQMPDGQTTVGIFTDGGFNGEVIERYSTHAVRFVGQHRDSQRHGEGQLTLLDGGRIRGNWSDGQMTGPFVYQFPSVVTVDEEKEMAAELRGEFFEDQMRSAEFFIADYKISSVESLFSWLDKHFKSNSYREDRAFWSKLVPAKTLSYQSEVIDHRQAASNPLHPELFELVLCYVDSSPLLTRLDSKELAQSDHGQGLFARIPLPADTLCSFYNGIRRDADQVSCVAGSKPDLG